MLRHKGAACVQEHLQGSCNDGNVSAPASKGHGAQVSGQRVTCYGESIFQMRLTFKTVDKAIESRPSVTRVNLILSAEGGKSEDRSPEERRWGSPRLWVPQTAAGARPPRRPPSVKALGHRGAESETRETQREPRGTRAGPGGPAPRGAPASPWTEAQRPEGGPRHPEGGRTALEASAFSVERKGIPVFTV